jgi:hypothetical protein
MATAPKARRKISPEQRLLNVIKNTVPEAHAGSPRAEAIGKALEAYYAHESVKAKCRAINNIAKVMGANQQIMTEAMQALGELSK